MAGITTPFTTPSFPFLQTVTQRALDTINPGVRARRTVRSVAPTAADADGRAGAGRVRRRRRRSGRATCSSGTSSVQRELTAEHDGRGRLRRVEDHPRRDSRHQPQPADGRAARAWERAPAARAESRTSASSRARRRSAIRRFTRGAAPQAVSAVHDGEPVPQQRRHDQLSGRDGEARAASVATGCRISVSYTRSRLMDDASSVFDASILTGPVANYPVADSFNRARERDYSTGDIPHVFVASAVWDAAVRSRARARPGRDRRRDRPRLDAREHRHAAVGHSGRGDADDQLQRVRRLRHAAAESRRRSGAAG